MRMAGPALESALAYATEIEGIDTAIYPVGRSLGKSNEPLRVAEEAAMLDVMSGGRLVCGFPVGLAYDANVNNGVPPALTRKHFDENLELVLKAWTEPEPFAWNGTFTQRGSVNLWPRPLQSRPPIWITGIGNPRTMQFTLDRDFGFNYFGWFGAKVTGRRIFDRLWQLAEESGKEANPYRMGFMQMICVADTDEEAERLYFRHIEYFFGKGLGSIPMHRLALPGSIDIRGVEAIMRDPGDFGIYSRMRTATYVELVESGAVVCGSVDTVVEQLSAFITDFRIGNLHAMLQVGSMPEELTRHNIDLFADKVMPRLREIWSDDTYAHHWWPERLGGPPGDPPPGRKPRMTTTTFTEQQATVWNDDLTLRFKVRGSGAPLVYFHSAAGLAWDPFIERLSQDYTVYAPEFFGTSAGDPYAIHRIDELLDGVLAYKQAIRTLRLTGAVAVGQSFGGMLAAEMASHFPDLFSRLVLLDPVGLWRDDRPVANPWATGQDELPPMLFADPTGPAAQAFLTPPADPEEAITAGASMVWALGCTGKFCWPIPNRGLAKRLHRVAAPTLIVWARRTRWSRWTTPTSSPGASPTPGSP